MIAFFCDNLSFTGLTQWLTFEHILSAAAWYLTIIHLCAVFPRYARKNRTPTKRNYHSAEG